MHDPPGLPVTVSPPLFADATPEFRSVLERHADRLDLELLDRALRYSSSAHRGQKRMSGEDFISHSIAVALILAEQLLDTTSIAAALLHDVVEDSDVRTEDIAREFGPEIAGIVDGLTKISHLSFRSTAEEQVENYRKLLLSIARDARVIIIKLADRLHNMRTLEHLSPERRERIALETREIYAPLAHRFGMAGVKAELEDLAFKFLEPEEYRDLVEPDRGQARGARADDPQAAHAARVRAQARGDRLVRRDRPAEASLVDLPEDEEAGQGLRRDLRPDGGAGHRAQRAGVLSRARHHPPQLDADPGAHQGLHREPQVERATSRCTRPSSVPAASSSRSRSARRKCIGPPSTASRRTGCTRRTGRADELDQHLGWFRQLLELQQDTHSPEEFLEFLKIDLYQDEIFIFTPKGDVKRLPKGSTPIDFAFHVHTDVGLHTQGARVNGRIAPLHRELKNGDTVEILTGPGAKPSRDWLNHVRTARARHKIKQWIKHEEETVSRALGKEIIAREIRRRRLESPDEARLERAAADALAGRWAGARDRGWAGRCGARAGDPRAVPRPAARRAPGAEAHRVRPGDRSNPARAGGSRSRASTGSWSATPSAASRCRAIRSSAT